MYYDLSFHINIAVNKDTKNNKPLYYLPDLTEKGLCRIPAPPFPGLHLRSLEEEIGADCNIPGLSMILEFIEYSFDTQCYYAQILVTPNTDIETDKDLDIIVQYYIDKGWDLFEGYGTLEQIRNEESISGFEPCKFEKSELREKKEIKRVFQKYYGEDPSISANHPTGNDLECDDEDDEDDEY